MFRRGGYWYLMIAEGGTERGHSESIARGPSIEGPFENGPHNPFLTARGTTRPIQNTGHGDLVSGPNGVEVFVMLGVRPLGGTRAFSPLGRETFITPVEWVDGWPTAAPVTLNPRPGVDAVAFDFADPASLDDPGWIAVRTEPANVASLTEHPGRLTLHGVDGGMAAVHPAFVGRRQRHIVTTSTTTVDAAKGSGGLAFRYDEYSYVALEVTGTQQGNTVTAVAALPTLAQQWIAELPAGEVELRIETFRPPAGFTIDAMGADRVRLTAVAGGTEAVLTELDGRYWTSETLASFTGRVTGLFASAGEVTFGGFRYEGREE